MRPRVFILGAGASFAAGFPLASHVIGQLFAFCAGSPFLLAFRNGSPRQLLRAARQGLEIVMHELDVREDITRSPMDLALQRFHELAFAHPAAGEDAIRAFYQALIELLYLYSARGVDAYVPFAGQLRPGDLVLTFNWDICLEMTLHLLGRPGQRDLGAHRADATRVLKVHGAIDYLTYEVEAVRGRDARRQALPEVVERIGGPMPVVQSGGTLSIQDLVRLRTYDLGARVGVTWDLEQRRLSLDLSDEDGPVLDGNATDLGPLQLLHVLRAHAIAVAPSPLLIAPGVPPSVQRWNYEATLAAVQGIPADAESLYVAGYSFPRYDGEAIAMLDRVAAHFGRPTAHVIDPGAGRLPMDTLRTLFGDVTLHETGFQEYPWDSLRIGPPPVLTGWIPPPFKSGVPQFRVERRPRQSADASGRPRSSGEGGEDRESQR